MSKEVVMDMADELFSKWALSTLDKKVDEKVVEEDCMHSYRPFFLHAVRHCRWVWLEEQDFGHGEELICETK